MKSQDIAPKPESPKDHFWHPGPNPTVDMAVIHQKKVLLIQRGPKSQVEAGKWALPGGFIDTTSKKGEPWKAGRETPKKAALRELTEETNLYLPNIPNIGQRLHEVGTFEGNQRDPRDSDRAWSKSHAFTIEIKNKDNLNLSTIQGQDDAIHAKWFPLDKLPALAFDHQKILEKALQVLREKEQKKQEISQNPNPP